MKDLKRFVRPLTIAWIVGILTFAYIEFDATRELWQMKINTETIYKETFRPPVPINLIQLKDFPEKVKEIDSEAMFWEIAKNSDIEFRIISGATKTTIIFLRRYGKSALLHNVYFRPELPKKINFVFYEYVSNSQQVEDGEIVLDYHWERNIFGGIIFVIIVGLILSLVAMAVSGLLAKAAFWLFGRKSKTDLSKAYNTQ